MPSDTPRYDYDKRVGRARPPRKIRAPMDMPLRSVARAMETYEARHGETPDLVWPVRCARKNPPLN